ncbi:hypothetical protein PG994_002354 [Apiospora phragmitis]|uniref:Uncharacterized protein n=1 Tax=Apiospora phragmitis TaxID=2905665 RepID=A0ABR1WW52_9PEZI
MAGLFFKLNRYKIWHRPSSLPLFLLIIGGLPTTRILSETHLDEAPRATILFPDENHFLQAHCGSPRYLIIITRSKLNMDQAEHTSGRSQNTQQKSRQSDLAGVGSSVGDTSPKQIKTQSKNAKKGDAKKPDGMTEIEHLQSNVVAVLVRLWEQT